MQINKKLLRKRKTRTYLSQTSASQNFLYNSNILTMQIYKNKLRKRNKYAKKSHYISHAV